MKKQHTFYKKLSSILLIFTLLTASTFTAYATPENTLPIENTLSESISLEAEQAYNTLTAQQKLQAQMDLSEISAFGLLDPNAGTLIAINEDGDNLKYTIDFGNYTNDITVTANNSIQTSFHIKQGNIENDLTITNTGEVYLDGNLVVYSSDIDDDIVMANVSDTYYTQNSPYGTSGEYTKYYTLETHSNIALENQIKNIATATFYFLISCIPGIGAGAAAAGLAGILYTAYSEFSPNCENLSCKSILYYHKKKVKGKRERQRAFSSNSGA